MQGAAWTIPVVAVATGAPFAAASGTPTLAFTLPSFSSTACGVISGVQVRRTTDGSTPDEGKQITVTLPTGYTFVGGGNTYSSASLADGTITLPDIVTPAGNGTHSFTASSDALSTSALVENTGASSTIYRGGAAIPGLPSGVTARDIQSAVDPSTGFTFLLVLGSDGVVYRTNSSGNYSNLNVISTAGITITDVTISSDSGTFFTDGTTVYGGGGSGTLPALPAGVAVQDVQSAVDPATGTVFVLVLGSDGRVYRSNSSSNYAGWNPVSPAGVTITDMTISSDSGTFFTDGTTVYGGGGSGTTAALPTGVTVQDIQSAVDPATGTVFVLVLGSDGRVYRSNSSGNYAGWNPVSPAGVTITDMTISSDSGTFFTDGTTVYGGGGSGTTAALPTGVTATDIQSTIDSAAGIIYVAILGSDGKVYRSNSSVNYAGWNPVSPAGVTAFTISSTEAFEAVEAC
ncbi:hypothetical protein Q0F99_07380 [Rathayibacter oskolensis]|uniref:hypothetical protein n=1 Tax=Rathayibacter oskolensis TaxID=1891671 RepID=UPI00265FE89C|nr:hypothetical protein [Rathayibacter oskolensis]WKK72727.1 hypothetical protein Q0F99_07380 [Rathayibacter oskolensis]